MLEISDNLKINLNAVVTINKIKDKWIARLKNGSSLVVTEEIANEIITSTGSSGGSGGGGSVEEATGPVNTETIQTLEAVPENPTSESFSIIRVNGVIYILTNTEGGN